MSVATFPNVFHPSDFSEGDEGAFVHALKVALCARGELTLMHVDEAARHHSWMDFPSVRETLGRWHLGDGSELALEQAGLKVRKVRKHGEDPAREVVAYVQEHRPNLIVLATHQREGLARWLHPVMAEPVARAVHTTTLFVPRSCVGFVESESGEVRLSTILVPLAHRPAAQPAVDMAVGMAALMGTSEVHFELLHVGGEADVPEVQVPSRPGWTREVSTWEGDVVDHILQAAETQKADLIVMATAGHHGFLDALRGSTTERVLRGAPCPLLAVPVL